MSPIERFIALPDAEKRRIVAEIEAQAPEERFARSKPLDAEDRRRHRAMKRKAGRPRTGTGSGTINISISIERDLLKKADAVAKKQGLSRSERVARSVRAVISAA
ncbi:MAG TPA: hypothetical protein VIM11_08345 [Tepidisphaeraceae bacterium]